ncbi:MAG: hypothetical protein ACREIA_05550 [Opitutaceae bacterium]
MPDQQFEILVRIREQLDGLQRTTTGIGELNEKLLKSQEEFRQARTASQSFGTMLKTGLGIDVARRGIDFVVGGLRQVYQLAQRGVEFNAMLETQGVAFETLLGSKEAAQERMKDLVNVAATTPFELGEIVAASKVLQAFTGDALSAGEGFRLVGDTAAALDPKKLEEFTRWIGRLYLSLTTGEPIGEPIQNLVQLGALGAGQISQLRALGGQALSTAGAMEVLTDVFGRNAGAMAAQAETWEGMKSTLGDTISQMSGDFAKPIFESFKDALRDILELLGAIPPEIDKMISKVISETERLIQRAKQVRGEDLEEMREEFNTEIASLWAQYAAARAIVRRGPPEPAAAGPGGRPDLAGIERYVNAQKLMEQLEISITNLRLERERLLTGERAAANDLLAIEQEANALVAAKLEQEEKINKEYQKRAELDDARLARLENERAAAGALRDAELAAIEPATNPERAALLIEREHAAAVAAIDAELDAIRKQRDKEAQAREKALLDLEKQRHEAEEKALAARLSGLEQERKFIDARRDLTGEEKSNQVVELLREENDLIAERIRLLTAEMALTGDEAAAQGIRDRIDRLQSRQSRNTGEIEGRRPLSMGEQINADMVDVVDQFGTSGQRAAALFTGPVRGAVQGVRTVMQGLLGDTGYWIGQLGTIGGSIMGAITQAITDMFTAWIANRFRAMAASITASKAEGAADFIAKLPGMIATAVSSYGVAVVIGLAAVAAALAAFESGGMVRGGEQMIRVNEGGEEFVVSNPAVRRVGQGFLERLNAGIVDLSALPQNVAGSIARPVYPAAASSPSPLASGLSPAGGAAAEPRINVFVHVDESIGRAWLEKQQGRKILYKHIGRDRRDLGIQT